MFHQDPQAVGDSLTLSALCALIPLAVLFIMMGGLKVRAWTGLKSSMFSTCSPFRANIAPCSRRRQAAIRGWGVGRSR